MILNNADQPYFLHASYSPTNCTSLEREPSFILFYIPLYKKADVDLP